MSGRTILAVLHDDVLSLNVAGPLEVFAGAGPGAYRITTASPGGRPVRTSCGLRMQVDADLDDCEAPHTLLVPGGLVENPPDPHLTSRIRALADRAERIVSVCTGSFLLGSAGLLEGHRATTHWAFCDLLAERFPATEVAPEPMFVRDGRISTSAGVTAGIDLALSLVTEDLGSEVARNVARSLVMFLNRPGDQEQFSAREPGRIAERHPLRELQRWIKDNPAEDLSVEALATRAALSPRQFARVFHDEVGVTPGRYVDQVRLDAARRRLEETLDGLDRVAHIAGYGTAEAMRRAFIRRLGIPPGEYRRRFRSSTTNN